MTLTGLGQLRLGLQLMALGSVLSSAQQLVEQDNGSAVVRILFQNTQWAASNLHFSADGQAWTGTHGVPMQRSLLDGEFSAANGWFQYDVPASQLRFAFNNGDDLWHHKGHSRELFEVTKPGTYAVHANDGTRSLHEMAANITSYVTTTGYVVNKVREKSSDRVVLELGVHAANTDTTYGANIQELLVEAAKISANVLRVRITDKNAKRWEVPRSLYVKGDLGKAGGSNNNQQQQQQWNPSRSNLEFSFTENPFSFTVTRRSDGFVLFDSSKLSLVFKDQYLQVSTAVASGTSVFGLGESTRDTLQIQPGDKHTLWARDQFSNERINNLYGAHPFYVGLNDKGAAHGVLLLNSNGMDVTLETDKLVYQTLGGVLDFHIVSGPTPADVISQYTALIGRPKMQPYWSYGFHQCRWGYQSVAMLREVVDKYAAAKIPLDIIWSDIDHMNKFYDFTLDPVNFTASAMQKFISDVHANGQKFVPIIDPGIADDTTYDAYTKGLALDVFIKDSAGKPYLGQVWPGPTVFPDFFHPKATAYWEEQLAAFRQKVDFDGIWLDMNELANFCPGNTCVRKANATCPLTGSISNIVTCCLACVDDMNKWDHPPFAINNVQVQEPLFKKGISTSAVQYGGIRQYDSHNLYGFTESIATATIQEKLLGKRSFTLSRSTFPGSGAYVAHWTGDNGATWNDIQWSVVAIQNFGLFGIPMIGADICGFAGATTEELCARWTALGALYPFARNHNNYGEPSQETYVWESVAAVGRKFIGLRYRLLPYLYTLGYEAHVTGAPIARPLFWEFPTDKNARGSPALDRQYLLGSALLITPVLTQGATLVTGYVPAGTWYDVFTSERLESKGQSVTWPVKLDDLPVLVRGGSVVPLHQSGAMTTTAARKTPYEILVALAKDGSAHGQLYLDDGEDLRGLDKSTLVEFSALATPIGSAFTAFPSKNAFKDARATAFGKLTVLGISKKPTLVVLNAFTETKAFTFDDKTQRLEVDLTKVKASAGEALTVYWV